MTWHFVLVETDGTPLGELTAAKSKKVTWPLNDAASASFTIDGLHPQALLVEETQTDLIVYDDSGKKRFRGRLGSSGDDIAAAGHTSSFSAVDYRGFLGRRLLRGSATAIFSVVEQAQIAWTLIHDSQSQTGGALGITQGSSGATGQSRSFTFAQNAKISDLISQVANLTNGFDWDIDADLVFNVYYPNRGSVTAVVLDYGGTVLSAKRTFTTDTFSNVVVDSGATTLTPVVAQASSFIGTSTWETAIGDTSILDQTTLNLKAAYDLAQGLNPSPAYALTLRDGWWSPGVLWVGDTAKVVVKSGRISDIYTDRVTQVEVDINDDGGKSVTLTVGPAQTRFEQRVTKAIDRISRLEVIPS